MSMDSKISQFQEWANRIGCPPQYIPRKVAIGRKWHCSIDTMMARVNPLDAANAARSKILIKSINHVESRHGIITKNRPTELVRYEKVQELRGRLLGVKEELAQKQKVVENLQVSNNETSLRNKQIEYSIKALQMRTSLLNAKARSVQQQINNETAKNEEIRSICSIGKTTEDSCEQSIQNTIDLLRSFYQQLDENSSAASSINSTSNGFGESQHEKEPPQIGLDHPIWERLRNVLMVGAIGSIDLWRSVNHQSEVKWTDFTATFSTSNNKSFSLQDNNSNLKMLICQVQTKQLLSYISGREYTRKLDDLTATNLHRMEQFTEAAQLQMELLTGRPFDADTFNEYIFLLMSLQYNTAELERLKSRELTIKQELLDNFGPDEQSTDFSTLSTRLRDLYQESDRLYGSLSLNTIALKMVKEKSEYVVTASRKMHALRVGKRVPESGVTMLHNNSSISFDSSDDQVLCSTKLENSAMSSISKLDAKRMVPQTLLVELKMFNEIPNDFFLSHKDSSNYRVLTQFANIIARYPHLMLLNAERFVHQLSLDNSWRSHMLQAIKRSPNIWINYDVPIDSLIASIAQHHDDTMRVLNETSKAVCRNRIAFAKLQQYFQFFTNNPLAKFIPGTRTYQRRNFSDFMGVFMMYYRVLNNDNYDDEIKLTSSSKE